ncbi:Eukaryotic translation initiation factor eIF-1 [Lambiella insularis]|nr:Eukaryotic translation initiation factor eIF-1 [Lambiella insularis]
MTDPFAEADEDTGETKQSERNGRKTLTTVQGLPKKFDQKKILKVIKKKFACNGTIVNDSEMGEVIQLQGDQRKDVQEFLVDKKEGLELDAKTIKVNEVTGDLLQYKSDHNIGTRILSGFAATSCSTYHQINRSTSDKHNLLPLAANAGLDWVKYGSVSGRSIDTHEFICNGRVDEQQWE